ncbi:hypothetical protein FSARC_10068 [Fusarium sarcochroum]|uniref:Membrane transporter n=1 Tax=Fusarium sarcochroum TaxID=1208366 RepID=A0A8H4TPJ9_9HYPO|nr:hypothetical protein FSARC_10068 [Fusarium sarcochroum]
MATPRFLQGKLRLNRPFNQNFLMGCLLFCMPGIYLALTGLGAGGGRSSSQETAALTNSILYGIYAVAGWCGGPVLNVIKPKWTVVLGGIGYPLYVASLWYYDRVGGQAFPLTSGAILGLCAALLWTASGFIQFAYAEEKDKALYITWQWVLTSSGSTVGALIALLATLNQTGAVGVSNAVYIAFIVIMVAAIVAGAFLIVDPATIVRDDGQHLAVFEKPSLKKEIAGIFSVMKDTKIIILLPAMFVGEMCLALVSSINAYYFNIRTRSLNNLLFQAIMIPAPILLAYIMDNRHIKSRRSRGLMGFSVVSLITMGATSGLLAWVMQNHVVKSAESPAVDWTDSAFAPGIILYLLFGVIFACFQISVQWTLSSLTNDPSLCARYAGAFKGTVALGMCISFTVDSQGMSFRDQIIMQLALYALGICCLFYVISVYVKQTNYFAEEGVVVPVEVLEGNEVIEPKTGGKMEEEKASA